ncbi:hypothetical protein FS749_002757 [Ceratobasidium sp. UAMH 11750]|nr:hypothetical protein FS749_002757 [Ceratobasidium sp. UAMH 11750]
MSYSWVCRQVSNLSSAIREATILAARTNPILLVHDNIRLKYGVRPQRGNNQLVSDNGTAATLRVLPPSASAFETPDDFGPFRRLLKAKHIAGTAPKLCYKDLNSPTRCIANRTGFIFDILDHFAMIPGLAGTKIWKSDRLKRPTGPQQLPHGPEHCLKQYMLPTTNIDESSYSGNARFILYVLNQLQLDTDSEHTRLVLE